MRDYYYYYNAASPRGAAGASAEGGAGLSSRSASAATCAPLPDHTSPQLRLGAAAASVQPPTMPVAPRAGSASDPRRVGTFFSHSRMTGYFITLMSFMRDYYAASPCSARATASAVMQDTRNVLASCELATNVALQGGKDYGALSTPMFVRSAVSSSSLTRGGHEANGGECFFHYLFYVEV